MNAATLFGLCGAVLVGFGLYGLITNPEPLRKILAFNLLGSGVFLVFGAVARRAAAAGLGGTLSPRRWSLPRSLLPSLLRPWLSRWCFDFCRKPADPRSAPMIPEAQVRTEALLMPDATVLPDATTTDGALLVLAIVLPSAGVLLSFALGGRYARKDCLRSAALRSRPCARSSSPTSGEAASG